MCTLAPDVTKGTDARHHHQRRRRVVANVCVCLSAPTHTNMLPRTTWKRKCLHSWYSCVLGKQIRCFNILNNTAIQNPHNINGVTHYNQSGGDVVPFGEHWSLQTTPGNTLLQLWRVVVLVVMGVGMEVMVGVVGHASRKYRSLLNSFARSVQFESSYQVEIEWQVLCIVFTVKPVALVLCFIFLMYHCNYDCVLYSKSNHKVCYCVVL